MAKRLTRKTRSLTKKTSRSEKRKRVKKKMWMRSTAEIPISAIIWAILLIYAGLILLADNLGYLDTWLANLAAATNLAFLADLEWWSVILLGAGIILLIEVLIRLLIPEYRRGVGGTITSPLP